MWSSYAVLVIYFSRRYAMRKEGVFEDLFVRGVVSTKDLKARNSAKVTERAVAGAETTVHAAVKSAKRNIFDIFLTATFVSSHMVIYYMLQLEEQTQQKEAASRAAAK
jgi:hypothetical protein